MGADKCCAFSEKKSVLDPGALVIMGDGIITPVY
jgi:hypothetical protein